MEKCPYCQSNIERNLSHHIAKCSKWIERQKEIENNITKDFLIEEYINQGKSLHTIGKSLGLYKNKILKKKLVEFGIHIRTLQEAKKQQHHIELAKQTSKEKYGYEFHLSKGCKVRDTLENNLIEKYGVDNIRKSAIFKDLVKKKSQKKYGTDWPIQSEVLQNKVKKTNLEKFGVDNPWKNKEIIEKIKIKKGENPKAFSIASKLSQELFWNIYEFLDEEDRKHCYFKDLNREFGKYTKEKYYYYDFVLTNKKLCIEFNGNYWHNNPEIFEENWINPHSKKTRAQIAVFEKKKNAILENLGFKIITIWEQNFKQNKNKTIQKCVDFLKENYDISRSS